MFKCCSYAAELFWEQVLRSLDSYLQKQEKQPELRNVPKIEGVLPKAFSTLSKWVDFFCQTSTLLKKKKKKNLIFSCGEKFYK